VGRGFVRKGEVLTSLKFGRDGAIQVRREAKINSPEYKAAGEVCDQIDALAELLTDDPRYFHVKMATADQQPKKFEG
jgi:hypothetical protein